MKKYGLYIDGREVDPQGGEWLETVDPYRGEAWASIARGGAEDVDRAVAAAKLAMTKGAWATMSATKRGKVLRNIGDAVAKIADVIAQGVNQPDFQNRFKSLAFQTDVKTGPALSAFINGEAARWREVITENNIRVTD